MGPWCGHGAIIVADLTAAIVTVANLSSSIAYPGARAVAASLTHKCTLLLHDPYMQRHLFMLFYAWIVEVDSQGTAFATHRTVHKKLFWSCCSTHRQLP